MYLEASVVEVPDYCGLRHGLRDVRLELPLGLEGSPEPLESVRHHHFVLAHGYRRGLNSTVGGGFR